MASIHILLAEDNDGDILLTREGFEDANIQEELTVVKDGKEAMDFLTRQGKYTDAEMPEIILLDITFRKKVAMRYCNLLKGILL